MQCPENPVFNGQLQSDMSIHFNYIQGDVSYLFEIKDDEIRYFVNDPEWRPSDGDGLPPGWRNI